MESIYESLLKKVRLPELQEKLCKQTTKQTKLIGYRGTITSIKELIEGRQNFVVSGPSGVGKTTVIRLIAEESKLNFMYIDATWLTSKRIGDQESELGKLFCEAIEDEPSLMFIDEIDHICELKRSHSDLKDRLFNMLQEMLNCLQSFPGKVIVIIATNRPETLDPKILKYFDEEIRFSLPSQKDRLEMLTELVPELTSEDRERIADATRCYLYKDLMKLNRIARAKSEVKLNYEAFRVALSEYKPKTVRDYTTPCPPLHWEDIGGVDAVKKKLHGSAVKPIMNEEEFKKYAVQVDRGALLYGPPGCSKTMLAQALATEGGFNFISIKGPELYSKYVGESEAAVGRLYRNAREIAPCIIFFDEIDGFATERGDNDTSSVGQKVVTQLLTEFNGPPDGVFTLAATNRPHRVDSALLRPGRLDSSIYIPLPSEKDRAEIFKVHLRKIRKPFGFDLEEGVQKLAKKTARYSGAEISKVCRAASRFAWLEKASSIEESHFMEALKIVKPGTSKKHIETYDKFHKRTIESGQRQSTAGTPARDFPEEFDRSLNLD